MASQCISHERGEHRLSEGWRQCFPSIKETERGWGWKLSPPSSLPWTETTGSRKEHSGQRCFWYLTDEEILPFLACRGWITARLRKEGEESHSQTKLNPTQYNPVSTPQWWVEGKGREQINQALSPPQVTPDKTHLHSGEAEVLN